MNNVIFEKIVKRLETQPHLRIVVFGASNTERHVPGIHWSDVFELGLRARYSRKFQLINAGLCGGCTRNALARFERDVLFYQPDIVIITFGGNDCNPAPERFVPENEFIGNLKLIADRLTGQGAEVVFQSYYKMIYEEMEPRRAANFECYMNLEREFAVQNNCNFIDQYALFDRIDRKLRLFKLMYDAMHLNEDGNILFGLNTLRYFDVKFESINDNGRLLPMYRLLKQTLE